MSQLFGEPTIFCDVDETLVIWGEHHGHHPDPRAVTFNCLGTDFQLLPHFKHIELLKDFKKQGFKVIVWSAAGASWAREIVNKLSLTEHVDHILSKPTFYIDDKFPEDFMHRQNRIYHKPE